MKDPRTIIAQAVDATFMQRGFNAERHADAIIAALNAAGYVIAGAHSVDTSPPHATNMRGCGA